jgi:hypothetical protein
MCEVFSTTPGVVSAVITDDLSGILVTWDALTNKAGKLPCKNVLNTELLGPNTQCLWGAAEGVSILFLSCPTNDWLLMADDQLIFLNESIRSANGLSAPIFDARVTVQPPLAPLIPIPAVTATLLAPDKLSSCSDVLLDVSTSTGIVTDMLLIYVTDMLLICY